MLLTAIPGRLTVVATAVLALLCAFAAPAVATDLSIGFLAGGACADDGTDAISFSISTDRTGPAAEHPAILVEWRPTGADADAWSTLGTGELSAENGYTYADTVSGLDFTGLTEVTVRATALTSSTWGDGRAAGDTYVSSFAVDHCDDPGENARANFTNGCATATGEPAIILYNEGVLGVDPEITFTVLAAVEGLTFERTVVLSPEDQTTVALVFTDGDGAAFETEDTSITVEVLIGGVTEFEIVLDVDCEDDQPDPEPAAAISDRCEAGQGEVVVTLDNPTDRSVSFAINIDGTIDTVAQGPGSSSTHTYTVADGLVPIAVTADGVGVASTTVDVDCLETAVDVSTDVVCEEAVLVVTLSNEGDAVDVVITVDGDVIADDAVGAGSTTDFTAPVPEDGAHDVVVVAGDVTVTDTVLVDCVGVLGEDEERDPAPDPDGAVLGESIPAAGFGTVPWLLVALLLTFFGGDLVLSTLYRRWERAHP